MLQLLIALYATLYAALSWRRFATFHSQLDMSYYLRQVWGLSHGHYDHPLVQAKNVLGLHLEPLLVPLALLGRLGLPIGPLVLVVQAVAVALSAWPAYRLGVRHLGLGARGGFVAALVALLYPTVSVATLHDFHPVTVALFPLLATIDALDEGNLKRALVFAGLALCCREDIALQLACLFVAYSLFAGAPFARTRAQKLQLWAIALGLCVYFFAYVLGLQPRYVPATGSYGLHFAKIGAALGVSAHSARELFLGGIAHPLRLIAFLFDAERLKYLGLLLFTMAFLPLFAVRPLAGALPILALNLFSSFPGVLRLESHYTTALVPFFLGAGLIGAGRLRALFARVRPTMNDAVLSWAIACALLFTVGITHVLHGGSPLSIYSDRFDWANFRGGARAEAIRQKLAQIPPAAAVAARPGPLAHLCERPRIQSPPEFDDGKPVDVILRDE